VEVPEGIGVAVVGAGAARVGAGGAKEEGA